MMDTLKDPDSSRLLLVEVSHRGKGFQKGEEGRIVLLETTEEVLLGLRS